MGHDCLLCFRPLGGSSCLASPVSTGEVASNASRWERLCLAYTSNAMKVYSLRSWRPLHRLHGPPPPLWQGRLEIRSVPLRGYGFEIKTRRKQAQRPRRVSVPLRGSSCLASPVATGEVASNASRWGRLCLACTSVDMKIYGLRPWRPLHRLRGPPADLSKKQALGRS